MYSYEGRIKAGHSIPTIHSPFFPFFARNLVTLVVMWAFPGEVIWAQTLVNALLVVPILIQVSIKTSLAYWLNHRLGEKHTAASQGPEHQGPPATTAGLLISSPRPVLS
jgi:hypothetical protein